MIPCVGESPFSYAYLAKILHRNPLTQTDFISQMTSRHFLGTNQTNTLVHTSIRLLTVGDMLGM